MRTAYIHATIHHQKNDAFIIENGRFVQFGTTATILRKNIDEIIDLNHHTVLPGFHDSHLHVLGMGMSMNMLDVRNKVSIEQLINDAKRSDANPLIGRGFHEADVQEKRSLTKTDLDRISTEIPVIIYRVCGHMVTANSVAIDQAKKMHPALPEDASSYDLELGHFKEDAMAFVLDVVGRVTKERLTKELLDAQAYLLSRGVTAVGSDDYSMYKVPFEEVTSVIEQLDQSGQLKLRIYEQANLPNLEDLQRFIEKGYPNKVFNRYRIGPLKLFADGSLGARSAYLSLPYSDADTQGIRIFKPEMLKTLVETAQAAGMDYAIHAIGDQMVEELCDLTASLDEQERAPRRHSIIHAQLARREQLERMKSLNIGAQTQPIFINSDLEILASRLGERMQDAYLFKSMVQAGIKTTISTDAPVEDVNPFENIYVAMSRLSIKRPDLGVYLPEERFTFKEAIKAYTETPAYFTYQERELGKLRSGYYADFVVVDGLEPQRVESLLTTRVLKTFIAGECVYSRP